MHTLLRSKMWQIKFTENVKRGQAKHCLVNFNKRYQIWIKPKKY